MKMTKSRDGEPRATLRTEHRLDAKELVNALCADIVTTEMLDELPELMPRTEVEKRIKACLSERGTDHWDWHENVDDAEDFRSWAARQIDHHYFPVTKS